MESKIHGVGTVYKANGNDSLALIIPKTVNEKLGIEKGAKFLISVEKGNIVLTRT
ncbi:MAG TPA: AbrB/MazE/SpoVT family DNA-binding domain-containing protein [Candidatus Nitrosotalea sp.]|nr:AbrB/MazE/SpoVT family DNA-binding domain-containing protein [Candidatus Nitrosotalea sp.]